MMHEQPPATNDETPTAFLVETIPQDLMVHLAWPRTRHTAVELLRLVNCARHKIDLTAVYWNLLHHPEAPDEEGFLEEELVALGATAGQELYESLRSAAVRGVHIRILESPGFLPVAESVELAATYPDRVEIRQVNMNAWYGGGILHQKLWLADGHHLYLGSANMDWRSLSQVKELGIIVENDRALVADLTAQFERWWQFAAVEPAPVSYSDPLVGSRRPLPCWSPLLPTAARCPPPYSGPALAAPSTLDNPLSVDWNGREATAFTTASPPALCNPGRTYDLDALRYSIDQARESVSLSVMHFAPMSIAPPPSTTLGSQGPTGDTPRSLWWPPLFNALLRAAGRGVHVRLLASRWPYSPSTMIPHLRALRAIAAAETAGSLEVRLFTIPGWDSTTGPGRRYPGHSRVNHPKFLVTEQRLNLGTSNMTWGDFHWNGGISLNTDHPDLVRGAQQIFDRDWRSPYALPLDA